MDAHGREDKGYQEESMKPSVPAQSGNPNSYFSQDKSIQEKQSNLEHEQPVWMKDGTK